MSIPHEEPRDPWAPRPIDLPREVPLEGPLDALDTAKIFAAPDDPALWSAWREALARWRREAAERIGHDGSAYERPELAWTQSCFAVALVWLWDELLYDHAAGRFTPERLLEEAERELGGFDGVVLWHAYPVIGIDERNQFDWYRDVPGLRELVATFRDAGVRTFLDYNPWDVGTRREPVDDATATGELVGELDVDGVFLDTMKEALPGLRAAVDAARPGVAFEGESTLPLERIRDHHLSWAQWFCDSAVPGVIRSRWFEQRHMLHHTRRWNRSHAEELHSAWLNGVGVLVWESVFGAWVGWNERDKQLLRAMLPVQRRYAALLAHGEWTPLAAHSGGMRPRVVASRWSEGEATLWAVANGSDEPYAGPLEGAPFEVALPARGIAAYLGAEQIAVAGGGEAAFPPRLPVRVPAPVARAATLPEGFVELPPVPGVVVARFRRRETGTYGEAPYVEEWKPLPPRLHDFVEEERAPVVGPRVAVAIREVTDEHGAPVTGLDLAEARAYAASMGARLPTEDEWQLAAEAGLLERAEPLVWNWTESEHTDGQDAVRDPEGRLGVGRAGLGLVRGRRSAGSGLLAQAPPSRGRPRPLGPDRLPAGGRPVTRPLDGVRVLEAATLFAAPLAGMLLGDYGADVVKIEHPRREDPARGHGPSKDGAGLWFKALARNKRLLTLDLSRPEGAGIFRRLAADADVVLENFRPGTLERWGIGPDELIAANPRLVVARVTGFGQSGPAAGRPGFGTLAEAMSGFAALNGEPDGPPLLPPLALADGVTGLATAFAILAALRARESTGRGQVIDTSLIEPLLTLLGPQVAAWDLLGELQPRTGNRSSHNAPRNVYRTADGSWVAVSASARSIAERVLRLVGRPDLVDEPWFATGDGRVAHVEEIDAAVASWIAERSRDDVLAAFDAAEAAIAPIYDARDIAADPQYEALGTIATVADDELGSVKMANVIARLSETPGEIRWAGRPHGADTAQILAELGLEARELEKLRGEGVV